jgi:hypothetical protein
LIVAKVPHLGDVAIEAEMTQGALVQRAHKFEHEVRPLRGPCRKGRDHQRTWGDELDLVGVQQRGPDQPNVFLDRKPGRPLLWSSRDDDL